METYIFDVDRLIVNGIIECGENIQWTKNHNNCV